MKRAFEIIGRNYKLCFNNFLTNFLIFTFILFLVFVYHQYNQLRDAGAFGFSVEFMTKTGVSEIETKKLDEKIKKEFGGKVAVKFTDSREILAKTVKDSGAAEPVRKTIEKDLPVFYLGQILVPNGAQNIGERYSKIAGFLRIQNEVSEVLDNREGFNARENIVYIFRMLMLFLLLIGFVALLTSVVNMTELFMTRERELLEVLNIVGEAPVKIGLPVLIATLAVILSSFILSAAVFYPLLFAFSKISREALSNLNLNMSTLPWVTSIPNSYMALLFFTALLAGIAGSVPGFSALLFGKDLKRRL